MNQVTLAASNGVEVVTLDLVTLRSATGEIERVVIGDHGDTIAVCRVEEFKAARAAGRKPHTVGFKKVDIVSRRTCEATSPAASALRRPSDGVRARTSRAARAGDSALHRLVVAAVRHAESIEAGAGWGEEAFIATDTEAQEAMLAFARSLSPADRRRLGRRP